MQHIQWSCVMGVDWSCQSYESFVPLPPWRPPNDPPRMVPRHPREGWPAHVDFVYMDIFVNGQGFQRQPASFLKMESLLSLSFDYLSSYDGVKVRKGLRQLEGLLAQICLSRNNSSQQDRRHSIAVTGNGANGDRQPPKDLGQLRDDPAFREFFKLQEGFEWNGSSFARPPKPSWWQAKQY